MEKDFKSPLTKRQKLQSSSYDNIRKISYVIQLRKNAGEIIDDVYSAETTQLLRSLTRLQVELNNLQTYTIPDVNTVGTGGLAKQQDQIIKKMSSHIILLKMLENKNQCPIAKIIDEI